MRVGQLAHIKSLYFVLLGKMRKEQSGDATETEKVAMRSVLEALGYSARESRPDLSGPVSILQSRFNRAQVSDIQETNRVVRLAKAHTYLALPVCIRDHVCGHVLAGRTGSPVSCKSHRVKRVVASASAAEAMGLSEAIARVTGYVHSGVKWCSLTQRNILPQ